MGVRTIVQIGDRRSAIQIIADILRLLRLGEAGKTEIMYTVNLSYNLRQKYVGNLLELGLLDETHQDSRSVSYRITHKGLSLLTAIENMQEMLRPEELPDILNSPNIVETGSKR
jgi:predicted transcriptional regulator